MRAAVAGAILGVLAATSFAAHAQQLQPAASRQGLQVSLHLHCFSGVPEAERTRFDYWNTGIARGNPDPDCVSRIPLLPPVPLRSVSLQHDPETTVELLRLDVAPAHQEAIQAALLAHQRRLVAVAVQGRIVSVVFVAGGMAGSGIPVYITDKAAASELESDLKILLGSGG
jgi:hypothetical protein